MTDPRNPQGPSDPWQPSSEPDPWAQQPPTGDGAPPWQGGPPTAPSAPTSPGAPSAAYGESDYVISTDGPPPPAYRDAPDPFGASNPSRGDVTQPESKSSTKKWIIPVAALVALAMIAAAVYFLFIRPDDKKSADESSPSNSQSSQTSGGSSESDGSGSGDSGAGGAAAIVGTYDVNGTIESYAGPNAQLGGAAKKPGDPAFKAPQTWSIAGDCADEASCELTLTITPGDATVKLTLDGDTWKGSTTDSIQCDGSGQGTEASTTIEIPKAGGTAKRSVTAACSQPLDEVDALTLTKK